MNNKTILVVDDEPHMLYLLEFTLKKLNCSVKATSNPNEAVQLATDNPIHLLIIDYAMEPMNGIEVIRQIREKTSHSYLPTIMLTGRTQKQVLDEVEHSSITHFLQKPFSPLHLLELCRQLI